MNFEEVLGKLRARHNELHADAPFIPGKTYIPATQKKLNSNDLLFLLDAVSDLWLTHGRYGDEFEFALSKKLGVLHPALFVNSGSSANLIAISSLGLNAGDEVLTVAAAFPTTVAPILQNRLVPVFVDIEARSLNPSIASLERGLSKKTKAVVLAHGLGNPFDAFVISDFCKKNNLLLVEDSCDALGGKIGGRPIGSFGDFSTLSFYPAHQITTGEGGAVLCKTESMRKVAQSFRDWGRDCWCPTGHDNTCGKRFSWDFAQLPDGYDHKYVYSQAGYNLKNLDLAAALGVSQLTRLGEFVEARRRNWETLKKGWLDSPQLQKAFDVMEVLPNAEPSYFGFALFCKEGMNRRKITEKLEKLGVGTRLFFSGNITHQPFFAKLKEGEDFRVAGGLSSSDEVMRNSFWVGVHPNLDAQRLRHILESLEVAIQTARS